MNTICSNIQTKTEIVSLKIIYTLIKRGIKPLLNQNGEYSFKRHSFNDSIELFILQKHLKLCNIRTKEQLNNLFNIYNNDMFKINININTIISNERTNYKDTRQPLNKSLVKTIQSLTFNIFNNYTYYRTKHILQHGITTFKLNDNMFKLCGFDNPTQLNIVKFGYINYYYGVILLANININQLFNSPKIINSSKITTDNQGYLKTYYTVNNIKYHSILDLRHPNTTFTMWIPKNNNNIRRLYINSSKHDYIIANKSYGINPVPTNRVFSSYKVKFIDIY